MELEAGRGPVSVEVRSVSYRGSSLLSRREIWRARPVDLGLETSSATSL